LKYNKAILANATETPKQPEPYPYSERKEEPPNPPRGAGKGARIYSKPREDKVATHRAAMAEAMRILDEKERQANANS
jgi:hypothetical protein